MPEAIEGVSGSPDCSPTYCEHTLGLLLRRLNGMCVKAVEIGDIETAKVAAELSRNVEDAMRFAGIE